MQENPLYIQFVINDDRAVVPTKANPSDMGFDLTAISVYKKINDKTTLYDTGIAIAPPVGYYTEIYPRSSISKSGYMLANSIGLIDESYRGNLLIALTKIDETMPDLSLPFVLCQLVLKRGEYGTMVKVDKLDDTSRGSGGFGSTNARFMSK
jgi:dUTP pyrophosphatase